MSVDGASLSMDRGVIVSEIAPGFFEVRRYESMRNDDGTETLKLGPRGLTSSADAASMARIFVVARDSLLRNPPEIEGNGPEAAVPTRGDANGDAKG